MSWTYVASSHSTGNRNALEVDAGTTENDLSGLIGMTGVTHYINESHLNVYEVASNVKIIVRGTLYHNPDTEILIMHHTNAGLANNTATNAFNISGTNANPAFYYYGTTRSNSTRGTSTNSKSTGLIFTGARISNWHPSDACMGGGGGGSTFVGRGGVILTGRPCTGSMNLDVIGTTWRGTTSSLEWRNPFGNSNGSFDGTFDGVAVLLPAFNATFKFANSSIGEVINQGVITYHTLREFDVSQNINDYDIGSDGMNGQSHREYEVINSATGTDVVKMWRNTRGNTGQRGVVVIKKEVSFNIKDASGTALEGVKLYLEDNPSTYAKNATFVKSKAFDTTNGYTASGDSPITRGTVNANGDMVYDYTTSEVYNKTSDASGDIAKFEVLTGVQIHEFNTNDADAATIYGMHIRSNGYWGFSSTDNRGPAYSDWDTANFGNFYRVDRRSDSNTNADDFTFKFCSYGHSLSTSSQTLKGLGELAVNWVLFDDLVITDTRATTDAYQEIDTPQKFYNRAKAYLVDNYAGENETIVSREGLIVNIGSYDLDVDANATEVFAFDGSKITIKASTFVGNITTTGGTISLLNGAEIVGSYGDISVLPFTITNVEAGSTVQLYNVTGDNEISNAVVSGTAGTKVTYSGTYANSLADANDEVRLRITCQSGATALLPYESFGVATSAGISFKANQVDDTVYNNNAIDGSASSYDNASLEIDADYTNFQLDVSDTDNPGVVTTQQIYAKYAYLITTSEGIDKFFGAITAENASNYRINTSAVDLKIQNISTSDMIISGARLYRDDSTTVIVKGPAGAGTLSHDTGEFLQYIQPQVTASLNEYGVAGPDDLNPIKKNTNLIPGLL
jgi:hypothetical protein